MKLKVCGMKYKDNITEVAQLLPDYMGFIFYKESSRFFDGIIPNVPDSIHKVGVFVDATIDFILDKIKTHDLQAVQLHGNETPEFCNTLRHAELVSASHQNLEIIKVFSIKDKFNFSVLEPYEDASDYFLFDTKGKLPGGNGYTFNWTILKDYPSTKPFFLSGGIGLDEIENIKLFLKNQESRYCYAIDVNSKFEIKPGLKDIKKLEAFKKELSFRT
ncbi:MAG: phosphoribosylanthranilate isomerase [Algicola sp.]|nr:phosphoribosylanthranilate isomerase [Algicola sp.]